MSGIIRRSAVILGGGQGRRFGGDKKEIVFDGENLIDRLIGFLGTLFDELLVSSNTPFVRQGVITVRDELGAGPLAGIYSALKRCNGDVLYVTACDMPFISCGYIERLYRLLMEQGGDVAAGRRQDGFIEPFNAFYRKSALPAILNQLEHGDYKISRLLAILNTRTAGIDDDDEFFNINFGDDLRNAEQRHVDRTGRSI